MEINNKNVYTAIKNKENYKVLILYNISNNHYVGIPVYDDKKENYIYIASIQKYLQVEEIQEYKKSNIKNNIYSKGKRMHVSDNDFKMICKHVKATIVNNLENKINYNNINDLKFLKWCYDKILLEEKEENIVLREMGIYWVNFGVNVGSELRKLRPRNSMEKQWRQKDVDNNTNEYKM